MQHVLKSLVLSAAVAATTLTAIPAANAQDWRYREYRHHRHGDGNAVAAGLLGGLAAGAIAGIALAPRDRVIYEEPAPVYVAPRPRYYEPAPRYAPPPRVVYNDDYYRGAIEPWSGEWYRYCQNRYRSFNSSDGTYVGYDGVRRFCEAN